jgi:hypothetical protein
MLKNRPKTKLLSVLIIMLIVIATSPAQSQYPSEEAPAATREGQQDEQGEVSRGKRQVYRESALRRFEIVTLVALPFTAIHSFLAVRSAEMIRQSEFAPELSSTDFKIIGVSAVSLAIFIGFWDWLHTHDKDPSQQLIPTSPSPGAPRSAAGANDWELEDSPGLVVPLVHVRF